MPEKGSTSVPIASLDSFDPQESKSIKQRKHHQGTESGTLNFNYLTIHDRCLVGAAEDGLLAPPCRYGHY